MKLKLKTKFPENGMTDQENKRLYSNYVFYDPKTQKKVEILMPNGYHSINYWCVEEKRPIKLESITLNFGIQDKLKTRRKEDLTVKEAYLMKNDTLKNSYTLYIPCELQKIATEKVKNAKNIEFEFEIYLIMETALVSFNVKPEFKEETNILTFGIELSKTEA